MMPELVLTHRTRGINLVAEDKERNLRELLNGQQRVELRLGLGEPLKVRAVDEEDDAVNLGEVITPEAASCRGRERKEAGLGNKGR